MLSSTPLTRRFVTRRPVTLRLAAAVGCAALALTGCGGDPTPSGEPSTATDSPAATDAVPAGAKPVVTYVTISNVGGKVEGSATNITNKADRQAYADQFTGSQMRQALEENATSVNGRVFAQVVGIGCFEPESLVLTRQTPPYVVKATFPKREIQCLVPMTTVAMVVVPRTK